MTNLFNLLEKANIVKGGRYVPNVVANMPYSEILDLVDEISAITSQIDIKQKMTIHSHASSLSLGGGSQECDSVSCRRRRLNELSRFSALYSDQVVIHNFLSEYSPSFGHPPKKDTEFFRVSAINDIGLLLEIRPLVEAGKIIVYTIPVEEKRICPFCLADIVFGTESGSRLKKVRKGIAHKLFTDTSLTLKYENDHYIIDMEGVEPILDHGRSFISKDLPRILKNNGDIINKIGSGQEVALSSEYAKKFKFHTVLANMLVRSLSFQMVISYLAGGATFLSNHEIDINILSRITNSVYISQRNSITSEHLKAMVPFAGDVPISKLLELRSRSEDEFITFRAALDKAIMESSSQKDSFSVSDARSLYADIIEPEVARLNKKVKEAKRDLIISPLRSLVASFATISFGVFTGLMPADIAQIASAIGLSKVIYDSVSKAVELSDINKSIRQEQYYFLWKIKKISNSS
jgi:hypothetical protein